MHLVSRSSRKCEVLDRLNLSLITRAAETMVVGASYQGDISNSADETWHMGDDAVLRGQLLRCRRGAFGRAVDQ